MKRIYKYELEGGANTIDLPLDAKPLTVQMQHGKPCIWVLLDTIAPKVPHGFVVVGTGHQYHGSGNYVGTFQMLGGDLVWHVFDEGVDRPLS